MNNFLKLDLELSIGRRCNGEIPLDSPLPKGEAAPTTVDAGKVPYDLATRKSPSVPLW
jgi:hypothetical protein